MCEPAPGRVEVMKRTWKGCIGHGVNRGHLAVIKRSRSGRVDHMDRTYMGHGVNVSLVADRARPSPPDELDLLLVM